MTGGQDSVINVYNIASAREDPDLTLIGHTQNVCALHVGENGTIVSGSWDGYVLPCSFRDQSAKGTPPQHGKSMEELQASV